MSDTTEPQLNPLALEAPEDTPRLPVGQQLFLLASILLLLLGGAITPHLLANTSDALPTDAQPALAAVTPVAEEQSEADPFLEIALSGEAAFVWDVQTQTALYSKNPDEQLPLASITKLMTALVATEILQSDTGVTINDTAVRQDGFSTLRTGESFTRETLSDLTLISSSNDGAYALANSAGSLLSESDAADTFVKAMNIRAEELGLTSTYFKNPTGLDISSGEGGAFGSARDTVFLMEYLVKNHPSLLEATTKRAATYESTDGFTHNVTNTNYYLDEIPGLIGSKTGYTELAGGNLVVAFNAGLDRPIIISVLGSTRHDRFTDVIALVEAAQVAISIQ